MRRLGPYWLLLSAALLPGTGCRHRNRSAALPPPPAIGSASASPAPETQAPENQAPEQPTAVADSRADAEFVQSHVPIFSQVGVASWYGPPYNNRRGANGKIYDQNALTAAHRTLPLNSLIRVTNLSTGQSAILRITDRGPFVPNRVLDLSLASAKAIGVWRPGLARVRIDVYAAPAPLDRGGRWCVQIGAFKSGRQALKLRDRLTRKYHTANVIEFPGPTGYWVRIRPLNDNKGRAVEIAHNLNSSEGDAYLVRLD